MSEVVATITSIECATQNLEEALYSLQEAELHVDIPALEAAIEWTSMALDVARSRSE